MDNNDDEETTTETCKLDKTHLFTKQINQHEIKSSKYEKVDRLDTGQGSESIKFQIVGNGPKDLKQGNR